VTLISASQAERARRTMAWDDLGVGALGPVAVARVEVDRACAGGDAGCGIARATSAAVSGTAG
jgi:hypothetical protein